MPSECLLHPKSITNKTVSIFGVSLPALASHDYILKIVPTVYEDLSGKQKFSYQYTVANKVLPTSPSRLYLVFALVMEAADYPDIWSKHASLC